MYDARLIRNLFILLHIPLQFFPPAKRFPPSQQGSAGTNSNEKQSENKTQAIQSFLRQA